MLTRRDLKSLKEGGQLTGDIASEIARRITDGAPHIAFLDSTFLQKVTPPGGGDTRCRRQYWGNNTGKGTESQIGTALATTVALHYVPGHWCCATADLAKHELVYYDSYHTAPDLRALDALGEYVGQVALERGGVVETCAVHFIQTLISTPMQPDLASCGICVLIEIQRIAEGRIDSPRDPHSDTAELLRFRAKWACAIISDPAPMWDRATRRPAGPQTAAAESDESDMEIGETLPNAARKRAREQPSDPRGATKMKRKPTQGGRRRVRAPSQGDKKETGGRKRRAAYEAPQDA